MKIPDLTKHLMAAGFAKKEAGTLRRSLMTSSTSYRLELVDSVRQVFKTGGTRGIDIGGPSMLKIDRRIARAVCIQFLFDKSSEVRYKLACALGDVEWDKGKILLGHLARDPNVKVRNTAHRILHKIYPSVDSAIQMDAQAPASLAEALPTQIVRRFTDVNFRPWIQRSAGGDLTFCLRVKPTASTAHHVDVRVPPGKSHAIILIHAFSSQFTVDQENQWIKVPRQADSEVARFMVEARQVADGEVGLLIFDEFRLIGSVSLRMRASADEQGFKLQQIGKDIFVDPGLAKPVRPIGRTIQVSLSPGADKHVQYEMLCPTERDGERRPDLISLGSSPEQFYAVGIQESLARLRAEVEKIEQNLGAPQVLGAEDRSEALDGLRLNLKGAGLQITDAMLSLEIRTLLAGLDQGTVINWVIRDAELEAIPWELAWDTVMDSALNEHMVLVRAPVSRNGLTESLRESPQEVSTTLGVRPGEGRFVYILGHGVAADPQSCPDLDLTNIVQGAYVTYQLVSNFGPHPRTEMPYTKVAKAVKGAHIIYMLCHGMVEQGQQFYLEVEPKPLGRLTTTQVRALELSATRPLVFVNACSSAAATFSVVGFSTLGRTFLRAGAAVYIGTLAPVTTSSAVQFASAFFHAYLGGGQSVPQAIFSARQSLTDEEDPTRLLYTVYGDPHDEEWESM